ncbi:GNAT family N-acetyltransferase [Pseudoalteromonas sp. MMG012]|uniref:GNAT family N-acetyltransferase n=1 Tax=Pseudoalteromonas sp. MMG012 TaxID=2822686 RepID=UPI001B3A0C7C|nr:GNAT family N-acetyltransferase [Pseudoalteromonas sp. MMG012]MBQ4849902.1 GNAT family N-acetyltransferase [Pseudoalteromonas sp. MMG012]
MKGSIVRLTSSCDGVSEIFSEIDKLMHSLYPSELNILLSVDEVDQSNSELCGIYIEGELAACGAVIFKQEENAKYGEFKRIYVKPQFRGLGLSKRILSHLISLVTERGLNKIMLETGVKQYEAIALYRYFGFYERDSYGAYKPDPESMFMQLYVADKPILAQT